MERLRFPRHLRQCGAFHKVSAQQGSTREQGPLVRNRAVFRQRHTQPQNIPSIEQQGSTRGQGPPRNGFGYLLPFRQKDSPLLQHRNKGLSCRVRFHHQNLLLFSFPAVCRGFALHVDSDRREGTCVCKIPHHCVPSPE